MDNAIFINDFERTRTINLSFVKEIRLSMDKYHAEVLFEGSWVKTNVMYETLIKKVEKIT